MTCVWKSVALIGYFGLFALLMGWHAWLARPEHLPVALVLLLLVGPLLFPLRGLLAGRSYTYAWTSFLALFYFTMGVFHAAGPATRPWLAWLEIAFSVALFTGAVFYPRARAREVREASDSLQSDRPLP